MQFEGKEAIVFDDPAAGIYKKLVVKDGKLIGSVLYGDAGDGLWHQALIREGASIETFREILIFGRAVVKSEAA